MARVAKCSLFLIKCIALGCNGFFVAASILSLIYNFPLKSVESFVAMLLLALIALAGLVMMIVETEWQRFLKYISFLKPWIGRAIVVLLSGIGLVLLSVSISNVAVNWVRQISGWAEVGLAVFYILLGLSCMQAVHNREYGTSAEASGTGSKSTAYAPPVVSVDPIPQGSSMSGA